MMEIDHLSSCSVQIILQWLQLHIMSFFCRSHRDRCFCFEVSWSCAGFRCFLKTTCICGREQNL